MLKQTLLAAIFTVGCTTAFSSQYLNLDAAKDAVEPTPGSIQVHLDVSSASSMLKYVTAFGPYYTVVGKSYDINYEASFAGIDLHINQVNVTAAQITDSTIVFVGDSDTLRTTLTGIDLTLAVNANATSLIPVPLDIAEVTISNLTIQFDLATSSDDQVHWQVTEGSLVSLEDFNVNCTQAIWQKVFNDIKPEMM